MNPNKIFSNWFYIFLFLWLLLVTLCLLIIGFAHLFLDETITQQTFLFAGFWLTFFSVITATILYLVRRYSVRYTNKNDGKTLIEINRSNWVKQGIKVGVVTYVIFLLFTLFMSQSLTLRSALMASPFFLLGFAQAYFLRNRRTNNEEPEHKRD